jgi:hypothetical protein
MTRSQPNLICNQLCFEKSVNHIFGLFCCWKKDNILAIDMPAVKKPVARPEIKPSFCHFSFRKVCHEK